MRWESVVDPEEGVHELEGPQDWRDTADDDIEACRRNREAVSVLRCGARAKGKPHTEDVGEKRRRRISRDRVQQIEGDLHEDPTRTKLFNRNSRRRKRKREEGKREMTATYHSTAQIAMKFLKETE
jgi:hypothetical protein